MTVEIIIRDGEEKVILSRQDYEDLVDSRDHALAMRDIAAGAPTLSETELDEYLAAKTPLAFWRRRAGLTTTALAEKIGVSQAYLTQIETGVRAGTVTVYAKLARRLGLRIEDLLTDTEPSPGETLAALGGTEPDLDAPPRRRPA